MDDPGGRCEECGTEHGEKWLISRDPGPVGVAVVCCDSNEDGNAHLIAAAPDLLAACEELQAFIGVMFGKGEDCLIPQHVTSPLGPSIRLGDITLQAANAILKARGK